MKPAAFRYLKPETLQDALQQLQNEPDTKILAGGQSLIPLMNMRLARPSVVMDIRGLKELWGITFSAKEAVVGAIVRHDELERHPQLAEMAPVIQEAERFIGHPAIRSQGTIGGSLSHADPAAELPVLALVDDWQVEVASPSGTRIIDAQDFFLSYLVTALEPTDIVARIHIPRHQSFSHLREFSPRWGDFAFVAAAAATYIDPEGRLLSCRMALGGVGDTPWRDVHLESQFCGEMASDALWQEMAQVVSGAIDPPDDLHASAPYRRHLAKKLLRQVLHQSQGGTFGHGNHPTSRE